MSNLVKKLADYQEKVISTKTLIEEIYLLDEIPWVIGYSGGKDSTATTQIIIETLIEMKRKRVELKKKVYVISSDTLVETPLIIDKIDNTIRGINQLAERLGLPISAHIVKPLYSQSFWTNLIGKGYPCPNQTFRWCTDRLKIEPANRFINNVVNEYGEAVMILGVRTGESNSRDRVLQNHTIEGKKLMRHTTMPKAYVFAPIINFTLDEVWNYLLQNHSPWNGDNKALYQMYKDSSSECPLIVDELTKQNAGTCGNSRFGCWVCTVVKEDKSLTGFIKNGIEWLRPLLLYRNWLYSIRDKEEFRMKRRNNGSLYFTKITKINNDELVIPVKNKRKKITIKKVNKNVWLDNLGNEWIIFDSINAEREARAYIVNNEINLEKGENPRIIIQNIRGDYLKLGNGPFTFDIRKKMLRRLLQIQKNLEVPYQLIESEELNEIRKIWFKTGDWQDSVTMIYKEVYGVELDVLNDDIQLFDSQDMQELTLLCQNEGFDFNTYNELLYMSKDYFGYINRRDAQKELQRIISKEFLIDEIQGGIDEG